MKPSTPGIYLFKFDNGNHRTMCEICSKLTNKETTWAVIRTFISLQFVYWLWLFPRGRLSNRINSTDEAAFTIVCYIIIHLLRTQNFPIIFISYPLIRTRTEILCTYQMNDHYDYTTHFTKKRKRLSSFDSSISCRDLFLYSLKTSENLWFSDVFRGYRKRSVAWNELKKLFTAYQCLNSFMTEAVII